MRSTSFVVALVIGAGPGLASIGTAQAATGPTIHNVRLHGGTGVLTITGTGLGADLLVTVDGQPVTLLSGATATQVEILAPATVVTTPGTYRLTVMDRVRQAGDAFVVASQIATVVQGGAAPSGPPGAFQSHGPSSGTPTAAPETAPAPARPAVTGSVVPAVRPGTGAVSPAFCECATNTVFGEGAFSFNTTGLYNTAIGRNALFFNSSGIANSASGAYALAVNTTGYRNTASGYLALNANTTGFVNTASGAQALQSNTTGYANTASGSEVLGSNTAGHHNTASGYAALLQNTTGSINTATGTFALYSNTTGAQNTASGSQALYANTTGTYNTASGEKALLDNTTGNSNTATGAWALQVNTTGGINTATGVQALWLNTTGAHNTASGGLALASNTTGIANTGGGAWALASNTTGDSNTALGYLAGYDATTGSHNLFLGANVTGTSADANTIRIGLPFDGAIGQNQTFIAGIYGTPVTDWRPVVIDANGQLGTVNPQTGAGIPAPLSGSAPSRTLQDAMVQQQLVEQRAINAELRARLSRLEALLAPAATRK